MNVCGATENRTSLIEFYFFTAIDTIVMSLFSALTVFFVFASWLVRRFEFLAALWTVVNCDIRSTVIEVGAWFFHSLDQNMPKILKIHSISQVDLGDLDRLKPVLSILTSSFDYEELP